MKIFHKGLILPPPLNFYLHFEDVQQGFDDDDDDDDALPVVVEVSGKAQAFAVYIYLSIYRSIYLFNHLFIFLII